MRIALCDDHGMFAESLALLLTRHGHTVTAITRRPEEAAAALREKPTDICLLDRAFPDGDGMDHVQELHEASPDCKILMLSAQLDADAVTRGVASRVAGFARKQRPVSELLHAIDVVADGQLCLPEDLLLAALTLRRSRVRHGAVMVQDACRFFTCREQQVLEEMVRGTSTEDMAQAMGMSTMTVRGYVQDVLTKLGVHTRLKAAVLAVREGVVDPESGEWILPKCVG